MVMTSSAKVRSGAARLNAELELGYDLAADGAELLRLDLDGSS
jgi:hypothetical protein